MGLYEGLSGLVVIKYVKVGTLNEPGDCRSRAEYLVASVWRQCVVLWDLTVSRPIPAPQQRFQVL